MMRNIKQKKTVMKTEIRWEDEENILKKKLHKMYLFWL